MTDEYARIAGGLLGRFEQREELESLLESLIPVLDSFDRLGAADGDAVAVKATVGRIGLQLRQAVDDAGLVVFGEVGDVADPNRYEIAGITTGEEGVVVEVVRRGYQKDGRVFRPAEVIVGGQERS